MTTPILLTLALLGAAALVAVHRHRRPQGHQPTSPATTMTPPWTPMSGAVWSGESIRGHKPVAPEPKRRPFKPPPPHPHRCCTCTLPARERDLLRRWDAETAEEMETWALKAVEEVSDILSLRPGG